MRSSTPHISAVIVAFVILIAQLEIAWFLENDWKYRLSARIFYPLKIALWLLWLVTASGIVIDLFGLQYESGILPRVLCSTLIATGILWGFSSLIAVNLYALCRRLPGKDLGSPERRRDMQAITAAIVASPFAVTGYGALIERTRYVVKEIDFPVPDLHPDLEGLRIAQISDLHVSPFLSVREAGRVVDMTNELKPNLTLMTGDLITQMGDPLDGTIAEIGRLRADAGVLGCLGNHEIYARCEAYATSEAAKVGVNFLRQRAVPLRWGKGTLNIAGVDFQRFSNRHQYLRGAEHLILPGASNILLSHNPDVFPSAVLTGYDAVIGGHTHGGQVTVEIVNQTANFARFFTPYVAGLYRLGPNSCYVNAGIGTIGMPVRIGAPPEITVLRLRRA